METTISTRLKFWDGIEAHELDDLMFATWNVTQALEDIAAKKDKGSSRSTAKKEKLLEDCVKILQELAIDMAKRLPPFTYRHHNGLANFDTETRAKIRELYLLVEKGLQGLEETRSEGYAQRLSVLAKRIADQRNPVQHAGIGKVDSCEVEQPDSEEDERWTDDRAFSPPPEYGDVESVEMTDLVEEELYIFELPHDFQPKYCLHDEDGLVEEDDLDQEDKSEKDDGLDLEDDCSLEEDWDMGGIPRQETLFE